MGKVVGRLERYARRQVVGKATASPQKPIDRAAPGREGLPSRPVELRRSIGEDMDAIDLEEIIAQADAASDPGRRAVAAFTIGWAVAPHAVRMDESRAQLDFKPPGKLPGSGDVERHQVDLSVVKRRRQVFRAEDPGLFFDDKLAFQPAVLGRTPIIATRPACRDSPTDDGHGDGRHTQLGHPRRCKSPTLAHKHASPYHNL